MEEEGGGDEEGHDDGVPIHPRLVVSHGANSSLRMIACPARSPSTPRLHARAYGVVALDFTPMDRAPKRLNGASDVSGCGLDGKLLISVEPGHCWLAIAHGSTVHGGLMQD